MAISFDNALRIHPLALKLREQRTELLASNLANADTPNYKAQDLDFESVLKGLDEPSVKPAVTQDGHQMAPAPGFASALKFRVPTQPSLDGNTVESEQEQVRYAENALRYQFSLRKIGDDFAGLRTALKGE